MSSLVGRNYIVCVACRAVLGSVVKLPARLGNTALSKTSGAEKH